MLEQSSHGKKINNSASNTHTHSKRHTSYSHPSSHTLPSQNLHAKTSGRWNTSKTFLYLWHQAVMSWQCFTQFGVEKWEILHVIQLSQKKKNLFWDISANVIFPLRHKIRFMKIKRWGKSHVLKAGNMWEFSFVSCEKAWCCSDPPSASITVKW